MGAAARKGHPFGHPQTARLKASGANRLLS